VELIKNLTFPLVTSAGVKLYPGVRDVLLLRVPAPSVFQMPVFVTPVTVALKFTASEFEQMVLSGPAFTVGCCLITSGTDETTGAQTPLLVDVSESVIVPARMSDCEMLYVAARFDADGTNVPVPLLVHVPLCDPPFTPPLS
jgi:hypothetical protein